MSRENKTDGRLAIQFCYYCTRSIRTPDGLYLTGPFNERLNRMCADCCYNSGDVNLELYRRYTKQGRAAHDHH